MITRAILEFITNLIPTFTLPAEILGAFLEVGSWLINVNYYVPVTTFVACLIVYLGVWIACAIISAVLKLL